MPNEMQTSAIDRPVVGGKQEAPQLKIEIPANRYAVADHEKATSLANRTGRYDMLCFEGISLMLNIFNGKQKSPNYTLKPSPTGELQSLTATEDVGNCQRAMPQSRTNRQLIDIENKTICLWSHSPKCQVHERAIRLVHRFARQASSEPGTSANVSRNRYT